LDVFRSLGLPIIDWRGKDGKLKWRPNSEEGTLRHGLAFLLCYATLPAKFLFNLGLRRYPPTEVILGIAAKGWTTRDIALNYFLDNYDQSGSTRTTPPTPMQTSLSFPAIHRGEKKLAKPLEVFSNPDWQSLGFPVLDPTLRQDAANILQIKEHPPTNQLVRLLETSPPTTEAPRPVNGLGFSLVAYQVCVMPSLDKLCADLPQTSFAF
jgi:hypothetical protein